MTEYQAMSVGGRFDYRNADQVIRGRDIMLLDWDPSGFILIVAFDNVDLGNPNTSPACSSVHSRDFRSARNRSPSTDILNTSSPLSYPSFRDFRADFAGKGVDSSRKAGV